MLYREMGRTGESISILGYGCMRYPQKNGKVDEELTEKQIMSAIKNGVNYFDTAYFYHGGKSETILGNVLEKNNCREKVKIADKMPPFLVKTIGEIEKIFGTQLERLKTTYIDYYLMHAVSNFQTWERLKKMGIVEFIERNKKEGKIKYIGFSYHGNVSDFKKIVDDYEWDFCQIQYNYLDEYNQAGTEGLKYASGKGLGVVIMEPLRGGKLAGRVPDKVKEIIDKSDIKRTAAEWALRWVWNHKEVGTVLSGMNDDEHIAENIRIASSSLPNSLTVEDLVLMDKVKQTYKELMKVPCTGCGYCMPCPYGVDIPYAFNTYNSKYFFNNKNAKYQYASFTAGIGGGKSSHANQCTECGRCEKMCPQGILIRQELKKVSKEFNSPLMNFGIWVMKKFKKI
ncbi:MAG TPA: aldo/keto reductase [Clostridiales bacterium]|nr:MAG: aldo/keto reductase [Clostridiales bacterium GWD2_32_19]HCC07433.1 aldo/keto reductase [Clostridiales bacterium]